MTIDAVRAGLEVEEIELDLEHRPTGRDLRGFAHRGRQLVDLVLACGPQARQLPGPAAAARRLRSSGSPCRPSRRSPRSGSPTTSGAGRSAASAPICGAGATTGTLKLVGIPLYALVRTRSLSGALLVGLSANAAEPARHAARAGAEGVRRSARCCSAGRRAGRVAAAVLLAPYDLREMAMLGDARLERARCRARFQFRGEAHGTEAVERDRCARRADPRR